MPKAAHQRQETGKKKSSPFTVEQELETWGGPPGTTEDQQRIVAISTLSAQSVVALWVRETMEVLVKAGSCGGREGGRTVEESSSKSREEKRWADPETSSSKVFPHLCCCCWYMSLLCIGTGSSACCLVRSSTTSSFISKLSRRMTTLCNTQQSKECLNFLKVVL